VARSSGEIRDVNIEVNAKNFRWADVGLHPEAGKQDLQSMLTHEMGHMLGLDHNCFVAGALGDPPLDDLGTPVPACDMASAAVQETTMFPASLPNDIAKRTLEPDDRRGVCATYPNPTPGGNADAAPPPFAACMSAVDGGADGGGADATAATDAAGPSELPGGADASGGGDAPSEGHSLSASEGCGCTLGERTGRPGLLGVALALLILLARPRVRRTMAPTHAHRRFRL
jgi:hypothetical protein